MEGLSESFLRTDDGACEKARVNALEGLGNEGLVVTMERIGVKVDLSMIAR